MYIERYKVEIHPDGKIGAEDRWTWDGEDVYPGGSKSRSSSWTWVDGKKLQKTGSPSQCWEFVEGKCDGGHSSPLHLPCRVSPLYLKEGEYDRGSTGTSNLLERFRRAGSGTGSA